ncbi:MAG: FtsW/RodA/SpoVE family cell cycle protein [Chloroflexota bacterium]
MDRKIWRHFDPVLLAATLLLIGMGVLMIRSATLESVALQKTAGRQMLFALAGLGVMLFITAFDYRLLDSFQKPIYALLLSLLAVVVVLGSTRFGAQRTLWEGSFQPSELAKVLLVLFLAKFFADHEHEMHRLRYVLGSLLLVAPPAVLVYLQPDLDAVLVFVWIWLVMALVAGMPLRHLMAFGVLGALAMPAAWLAMKDYMRERLISFLVPSLSLAARYNVDQALVSIGSGGWLGKGYTQGTQTHLHFLFVRHTDFIFSVIGEELGFAGAMVVIVLLTLVLLRLLRAAYLARDAFGRNLAVGVAAFVFFQAVVNIGMNMSLLPATGTPLPFITYGGSSLITLCIAEGLVQSVLLRHKMTEFSF